MVPAMSLNSIVTSGSPDSLLLLCLALQKDWL